MTTTKIPNALLVGGGGGGAGSSGFINPESYGFDTAASGSVNAAALVAALTAAAGAPVLIPAKSYTIDLVEYTGQVYLVGSGINTRLTSTSAGAGIHIKVDDTNFGTVIGNFTLNHQTNNGGTHGIHVEITGPSGYFGKWHIFNVFNDLVGIHRFGTSAIYLDNTVEGPGFATGLLEGCQLSPGSWAGIHGDKIGDSNKFLKNVVNNGPGIALDLSSISAGARQTVIEDNNFTALGGQILLDGHGQAILQRNWMEHPAYIGNFLSGRVQSQLTVFNCYNCHIEKNTINGGDGGGVTGSNYGIVLNGTTKRCLSADNYVVAYALAGMADTSGSAGADANRTSFNIVI
jgi:hypothetical protein